LWNRGRSAIHVSDGPSKEEAMSAIDRFWLNGFTTVSEMLANDRLAIEEVRRALEDPPPAHPWLAAWMAGLDAGIRASFGD
jgi:hypothetical protein